MRFLISLIKSIFGIKEKAPIMETINTTPLEPRSKNPEPEQIPYTKEVWFPEEQLPVETPMTNPIEDIKTKVEEPTTDIKEEPKKTAKEIKDRIKKPDVKSETNPKMSPKKGPKQNYKPHPKKQNQPKKKEIKK